MMSDTERFRALRESDEFAAILAASARLGKDPLQVQAAGGNTSIKRDGAMWIKASGTWLAEAQVRDIMVPVDAAGLRKALFSDDPEAQDIAAFTVGSLNPNGMRGSIETPVHAALDWPVVLHTHCVATIAIAVRTDAEAEMLWRLAGIDCCFVPYVKPGWDLARAIAERVRPETQVVVLGNHGLVACGETVAETEALLRRVSARLHSVEVDPPADPAEGFADSLRGTGWAPAEDPALHAVAYNPGKMKLIEGKTLYPDHAVFLGSGVAVALDGEHPADAARRSAGHGPVCKLVLYPGKGAAIPIDADEAVQALARCLGDVAARIEPAAELTALSARQVAELVNWDAEKHRRSLRRDGALA